MRSYRYSRMVHWSECDPAGIIFFPHYARWMAEGLMLFLLDLGVDPVGSIPGGGKRGIPSAGYTTNFRVPAALHDQVVHEISVTRVGRSSLAFDHRFLRGEDLLAEASEVRVWVEMTTDAIVSQPVPDEVRALLHSSGEVTPRQVLITSQFSD